MLLHETTTQIQLKKKTRTSYPWFEVINHGVPVEIIYSKKLDEEILLFTNVRICD